MNIYLIGMMGSGKSTVGKTLSEKMHKPFIDLDSEIEKGTGKIFLKYLILMEKSNFVKWKPNN